jgi:prophage DNA circulation protein
MTVWTDRVLPVIQLVSPLGTQFDAKWRGSPRTLDKKLGIFIMPKIAGNYIQDLDVESAKYSTTFYFDGPDHDILAANFFECAKENGQWTVIHPIHGPLSLQLVSCEEKNEPVDSGNITEISCEWVEPLNQEALKSAKQYESELDELVDTLNNDAAESFSQVDQSSFSLVGAIRAVVSKIKNFSGDVLGPIASSVDDITSTMLAVQDAINDTLNATVLQTLALAGQIQQLQQLPSAIVDSLANKLDTFEKLAEHQFGLLPSGKDRAARNQAQSVEMSLNALTGAVALCAMTGTMFSRRQAIEAAARIQTFHSRVSQALDSVQNNFAASPLEDQYYAQTQTRGTASLLIATTLKYLYSVAFNLKTERRITLDRPRVPIEIAATEYGGLGIEDANFELFVKSNDLHGDDLLYLPAGREILIYA